MKAIRVFVTDDHPAVRDGLRATIEGEVDPTVVGEADTLSGTLDRLASTPADVVIADVDLADASCIEILPTIGASSPTVKTLIVSMHARLDYVEKALSGGARGYVSKQSSSSLVAEGVRPVVAGGCFLDDVVLGLVLRRLKSHPTRLVAFSLAISHRTVQHYQTSIYKRLGLASSVELVRYAMEIGVL